MFKLIKYLLGFPKRAAKIDKIFKNPSLIIREIIYIFTKCQVLTKKVLRSIEQILCAKRGISVFAHKYLAYICAIISKVFSVCNNGRFSFPNTAH